MIVAKLAASLPRLANIGGCLRRLADFGGSLRRNSKLHGGRERPRRANPIGIMDRGVVFCAFSTRCYALLLHSQCAELQTVHVYMRM